MAEPTVLYWNHATPDLHAVVREETPPGFRLLLLDSPDRAAARARLAEAEFVLIADWALTAEDLEAAPRLRLVQHQGVGYERIDTAALAARKIPLCLCPAGTATGVGEHTLLLILALLKKVVVAHQALVEGRWLQWALRTETRDLDGKTLGLIGFGRTGRATARRTRGFELRLLAHDPYISLTPTERAEYGVELVGRDRLLREADIVSCHVPLTAETRHLVNRETLGLMKPSAYLVNVSRGGVVDQEALVEALRARRIAGAALDVFEPEPLPPGHPLTTLDNVVLTPHIAAGTLDAFRTKMRFAFANLRRVVEGEPPLERVPGT
ncbi:MAG TPA: 2-hydroxyacid dehydrogenase [Methylomirabilota bacterium]|jgi:phosphoglycerate dehydrogenase-like enzyme|nr:2-hydroxyacid dehydrogenase [Methylomirabilota bacterium]